MAFIILSGTITCPQYHFPRADCLIGIDLLATSSALSQILFELSSPGFEDSESEDDMDLDGCPIPGSSSQPFAILQPQDCKDVQSAMKALIAGFVRQYEG